MIRRNVLPALRFNKLVEDDREDLVKVCKPIICLPMPISNSIESLEWFDNFDNSLFKFCDEPLENK